MKIYLYILLFVFSVTIAPDAFPGKDHEDPGKPKKEGGVEQETESDDFKEKVKVEGGFEMKLVRSHTLKRTLEGQNYKIYLIDLRSAKDYREGHIKGAHNIPLRALSAQSLKRVIPNKDDYVVFYHQERESTEPTSAAVKAFALGYTKIYKYYDGYEHWDRRRYPRERGDEQD